MLVGYMVDMMAAWRVVGSGHWKDGLKVGEKVEKLVVSMADLLVWLKAGSTVAWRVA